MNPTFYAYFGGILLLVVCLALMAGLACALMDKLQRMWESFVWAQRRLAFHEVGKRVLCETYYFSRSVEAMLAIEALGEALRDSDGWRVEHVDELWQRKLSEHKARQARELEHARKIVAEAAKP